MGFLYFFPFETVLLNGLTEENLMYLSLDGPLYGRLSYRAAAV